MPQNSLLPKYNGLRQYNNKQKMTETCRSKALTDFEPLQKIGEGSFSSVYKVKRIADNKIYAIKKVKLSYLSQRDIKNALNQARILASIDTLFIVKYREAFYDEGANALCIVMEFADGGDLQKVLAKQNQISNRYLPEEEIWKASAQILSGLQLLHSKGILHRDLKTANIFICNNTYKIGDMNVSKVQEQQQMAYTQTGTPYYASPEVWRDQPYDARSDIWSFGCIIYEISTLHPPFQGKDIESLYKRIKKGKYEEIPDCYSSDLSNFIDKCLHQNPQERPTANQLLCSKSSIILKKCREYGITLEKESSFKLLKTINYKRDNNGFGVELPQSKYDRNKPLKNKTEETMGESISDKVSSKVDQKSARNKIKESKIVGNKRYNQKKRKTSKVLKTSQDKHSSNSSEIRRMEKFKSMKNILDKNQLPRLPCDNHSHRQVGALIDIPHLYPKSSRARNLTTVRKREDTEEHELKELDVIKEIRKRLDSQKTKIKKSGYSGQVSLKLIQSEKKPSFVNLTREEQDSKLSIKGLKANGDIESNSKCLKKASKRSKKIQISQPYIKRQLARVQSQVLKIDVITQQPSTCRKYYLKKKSKPQQIKNPKN